MNKDYVIQKKNILSGSKECVRRRMMRMKLGNRRTFKKRAFDSPRHGREFVLLQVQGILKSSTDSAYYLSMTCCNIFSN